MDIAKVALFILVLLCTFQLKHFVADYILQTDYMLGKFKKQDWELPLLCHTLVHAFFTFVICVALIDPVMAFYLACFDLCVHFVMDRIKASPSLLGRFNPKQKIFWITLGIDQMVHHLTHYIIIFTLFYYFFF